jgi:uncharacterized Tic20 family protein
MYSPSQDEKTMGMLCHLTGLLGGFIAPANIIAPLIIWLIKKDKSTYIDAQGKEALNFQISATIYAAISGVLVLVLVGLLLLPAVFLFWLIFSIIGTIKSSSGELYRYPLTLRLIK